MNTPPQARSFSNNTEGCATASTTASTLRSQNARSNSLVGKLAALAKSSLRKSSARSSAAVIVNMPEPGLPRLKFLPAI